MDSSNKQRLIGVMVLIAVATIVLPVVFHQSSHRNLALSIPQIAPPPPELPAVQIAPPTETTPITQKMSVPSITEEPIDTPQVSTQTHSIAVQPETIPQSEPAPQAQSVKPSGAVAKVINKTKIAAKKVSAPIKNTVSKVTKPVTKKVHALTHASDAKKTIAWDVQLGSFSNAQNANTMVKKLRKNGFNAYTKIGSNAKGKATRVCIGPELSRNKADDIVRALASNMHIKSIVVKHPI